MNTPNLRWRVLFFLSLRLIVCAGAARGAGLPEAWISSAPPPPPQADYKAVTHRNGRFVAVGGGGAIATSDDGFNWVSRASGTTNSLNAVAAGTSLFVAVGDNGTIVASTDGAMWTSEQPTNLLFNLIGVAFGNGVWIVIDGAGHVGTSSDAVIWNQINLGTNIAVQGIAFGNGLFAILSGAGLWTSSDGIIWLFHSLNGVVHDCIGFGGGTFLLAGESCIFNGEGYLCQGILATSSDSTNWTSQQIRLDGYVNNPSALRLKSVGFGNGRYMAARSDSSVDLLPAVCYPSFIVTVPGIRSAVGTNGVFVAVGSNGIYSTTSPIYWPRAELLDGVGLGGIAYGNGAFVTCQEVNAVILSSSLVSGHLLSSIPSHG